jgi:hypothetical protein
MAWLELHQSLPTHRKTLAMADALDTQPAHIVGHIACLWLWALDNAQDGVLHVSPRMVARAAQWEGDPQAFMDALLAAGFLDADGYIHDWDEYAGRLIEIRRRSVTRAKSWREQHGTANVPSISSASNAHDTHNKRVANRGPDLTGPNQPNLTNTTNRTGQDRIAPDADAPVASRSNQPAAPLALSVVPTLTLGEQSEEPPARATGTEPDEEPPSVTALRPGPSDAPEAMTRPGPLYAPIEVPKPVGHPFGELWDAFDAVFGEARTRTEQSRRGRACKEARESHVGGEELLLAAQHWPNVMGDATMTELGIVANLGKLLYGPQVNGRSNGTVTAHTQRLTETALVPHQATVADIRRRRKANDEPGR